MIKRPRIRQFMVTLSNDRVADKRLANFIGAARRNHKSATIRTMLDMAWSQLLQLDRETFEARFPGHNFDAFHKEHGSARTDPAAPDKPDSGDSGYEDSEIKYQ